MMCNSAEYCLDKKSCRSASKQTLSKCKNSQKKLFLLAINTPHTAKNIQTSIDAFRLALRLKASAYADELYAALD